MRKNYSSFLEVQLYLLVEAVFQVQLWRLGLHWLQLDGHVLVVVEVLAQSQLAKVAATDLLAHPEVGSHLEMQEQVRIVWHGHDSHDHSKFNCVCWGGYMHCS